MGAMFIKVNEIFKNPSLYYAHKKEMEEKTTLETLEEHTQLSQRYFQQICGSKGIERNLQVFFEQYLGSKNPKAWELFEEMWRNVVTFHDMGKHNPNFQRDVLSRAEVEGDSIYHFAGSGHSALSAVLYMDYFYKRLKELGGEDGKRLCILMMCNAYAIARHHSGLVSLEHFLRSITEGKNNGIIKIWERKWTDICVEEFKFSEKNLVNLWRLFGELKQMQDKEQGIWLYFYEKLIYSLLVASDYYATSEFMSGVKIRDFGETGDIERFFQIHQSTMVNQSIREYQKEYYPMNLERLKAEKEINILRNEIFLDAEHQLLRETEKNIFYLEAPTGSGKSNIALNLGFQLAMKDEQLKKIYYVYPFNTLVEQNQEILQKVFQGYPDIMNDIAVINSITPIKYIAEERRKEEREEIGHYYEKALLNRQFLNYPIILTTHVSLFDTIFGDSKESAFGFHQLSGAIIVLDEIQSYKNDIWGEIIIFLTELAKFMHMKIIIMSATLPNLELLKADSDGTSYLITNRNKYFCHPCFQKRVEINGELLNGKIAIDRLYQHVKEHCGNRKKILVEFITKKNAEEFYQKLKQDKEVTETVLCMTGDDSILERKKMIQEVKKERNPIVLAATQVIEAGIDIDMDIGYKNIGKMDSEEQFLGRINRSYESGRTGIVYFFELDRAKKVYGNDIRSDLEFMITDANVWRMLEEKDFESYYKRILGVWKQNRQYNLDMKFFPEQVGALDIPEIKRHMQLIEEQNWNISVYLGRKAVDENGNIVDGNQIWEEYKMLLRNQEMNYAEKRIKLSEVTSKMNGFIYQIKPNAQMIYNEQVGEIFYIEEGEQYFENGRLNRKMIQGELEGHVDFI